MLTFDCPPSGAICWAFPGTPALPSPSSLLAPRAAPPSALSGAVPLGTPLGLSVSQSPVRPRGSLVAAPCRALGGPTQRSERPEAPCREQVSLLLQLLTCSSVRAAGRTLRLRNSCNGVVLGRLERSSAMHALGTGNGPEVPWGCCPSQPPPLCLEVASFLISTAEALLLPLQEPLIGPFP